MYDGAHREHGMLETWQQKTIPAMQQSVLCCLLCSQEHIEGRKVSAGGVVRSHSHLLIRIITYDILV